MNRNEYIEAVKNELGFLPHSDVVKAAEYFSSFFGSGRSDEEVMESLGTPKEAAKRYCKNMGLEQNQKEEDRQNDAGPVQKKSYTGIVAAVITAVFLLPIWLPILILITVLFFAAVIFTIAISFGMWLGGGAVIFGALFSSITAADKLIQCGCGFIMFGVGLILSWLLVRAVIAFSVWIIRKITHS